MAKQGEGRTASVTAEHTTMSYIDYSVYEEWLACLSKRGIQRTGRYSCIKNINSDLLTIGIESILSMKESDIDKFISRYI